MFFRRKTKENHTKSVQNVRKLVFSLGKTKENGVFPRKNQGKATKKKTPPPKKGPPKKNPPVLAHLSCSRALAVLQTGFRLISGRTAGIGAEDSGHVPVAVNVENCFRYS